MEFVSIPGGVFQMGSGIEQIDQCVAYWGSRLVDASYDVTSFRRWIMKEFPRHSVAVAPFSIGRFPVTNAEYYRFATAEGLPFPESLIREEPDNHPVWGLPLDHVDAYCAWLSARLGRPCRLPTEAEWEYCARGPSGREYPFGNRFDPTCCNTLEAGIGRTTPVDAYPRGVSQFGVWDLAGNVEEYTADYYAPYPGGVFIEDDLSRMLGPRYRVLRGGSFARGGDLARCARRHGPYPSAEFRYIGFRVVIPQEAEVRAS